jgi:predicted unusual protein kinase regulating ubiquinone biosynthesis (AarF/ABC1/UbiB family)
MMIGAGSFGRVYKGRWAGKDVAVKVIEHESASAVENEVRADWTDSTVTAM